MSQVRIWVEYLLQDSEDNPEEFALWAFGENYRVISSLEYLNSWNALHGTQYLIKPKSSLSEDLPKMIELWRKERNDHSN